MASVINTDALNLNAKENQDFASFVHEQIFQRPELRSLHKIFTGVKMDEQIVLVGSLGKTGLVGDSSCTRKQSGSGVVLSEKKWQPKGIEDTLPQCNAALNGLFKAYFDKITEYKKKYDISGSDEETFLALLLEESAMKTVYRAAWFADTAVAVADADSAGLIDDANIGFYNYFDGLFKQIFTGVGNGTIKRFAIPQNAASTKVAQENLSAGDSVSIFEGVWKNADARLKSNAKAQFYVSELIFENYRQYLQSKGENSSIDYTQEGFQSLKWNGKSVVNMATVWGLDAIEDFTDNTTNNAYYLLNRVVLSTPDNLPIATMNDNDFNEIESWYERKERVFYLSYGFSLDAKVIDEKLISVAY